MKKERKVRKSVIFHRPKTLKRDRDPMYSRKGYVPSIAQRTRASSQSFKMVVILASWFFEA